jgi:hypothetical protein
LERATAVTPINLSNQDAIVPVVEGDARSGDEANTEAVVNSDAKPFIKLSYNPMAPVTRVPAPAVDKATGRNIAPRCFASRCECRLVAFHHWFPPPPNGLSRFLFQ